MDEGDQGVFGGSQGVGGSQVGGVLLTVRNGCKMGSETGISYEGGVCYLIGIALNNLIFS